MKAISVIVLLITSLVCCGNKRASETISKNSINIGYTRVENNKDSLTYKIITNSNKTYGYDILVKGRLTIHQPSIPSRPGNNGFLSKQDARKVALLVIEKIRKGEMPPTVTQKEIKNLGVVY